MNKKEKIAVIITSIFALTFGIMPNVYGMHIMEGYLPGSYCILWGVISLPFVLVGFFSIKKQMAGNPKLLPLLAMAGAFVFVISSLKIPSVTGSCSHMTGTGLGALLFGPTAVSVLGVIVLLFQAILLAHGGLTTLGANTFSMAIAGPILTFVLYKVCKSLKINRNVSIFLAACLGDLFTYCVTALQMAMAHHSSTTIPVAIGKFLMIFAPTQVPLAIIEGLITVLIINALEYYATPEMKSLGFVGGTKNEKN